MEHCKRTFLHLTGTVADAIRVIEQSTIQICLVVDSQERLMGTVTDGDVRRGILRALPLDAPVTMVMRREPRVGRIQDTNDTLIAIMTQAEIQQLPLCDATGRVVGLVTLKELSRSDTSRENWVVLMAGGLGQRLRPLTDDIPKPLLNVGHKPLLETLLESFLEHNFSRFYMAVNYRADMIKDYFGDGQRWNCTIRYIEENERLGTAGALSLLPNPPTAPIIVMNGDVLTKVNFANLLNFHIEQGAAATMCVREYDFEVPYGVVEIEGERIVRLTEKPVHRFFVNAGIYVLNPHVLQLLPDNQNFNMPDLFSAVISKEENASVFPIREYWIDIGRPSDFVRANNDFVEIFS